MHNALSCAPCAPVITVKFQYNFAIIWNDATHGDYRLGHERLFLNKQDFVKRLVEVEFMTVRHYSYMKKRALVRRTVQ